MPEASKKGDKMRNKKNKSRRILRDFMENSNDCYAIFQVDYDSGNFPDRAKRIFSGMAEIKNLGLPLPSMEQYQTVYCETLPSNLWRKENITSLLDNLYEEFNIKIPDEYTGHSMSVSDVVAIKLQGEIGFYFVDVVGFVELANFVNDCQEQESPD